MPHRHQWWANDASVPVTECWGVITVIVITATAHCEESLPRIGGAYHPQQHQAWCATCKFCTVAQLNMMPAASWHRPNLASNCHIPSLPAYVPSHSACTGCARAGYVFHKALGWVSLFHTVQFARTADMYRLCKVRVYNCRTGCMALHRVGAALLHSVHWQCSPVSERVKHMCHMPGDQPRVHVATLQYCCCHLWQRQQEGGTPLPSGTQCCYFLSGIHAEPVTTPDRPRLAFHRPAAGGCLLQATVSRQLQNPHSNIHPA